MKLKFNLVLLLICFASNIALAADFILEGKIQNLGGKTFTINRIGAYTNVIEIVSTDTGGAFYYQSKLLGNEALTMVLADKIYQLYIEPGDHIIFNYDASSQKLISLTGITPEISKRYRFDFTYNGEMIYDVAMLAKAVNEKQISQDSAYGAFQKNLDRHAKRIDESQGVLGPNAFKYYADLYFSHLLYMKTTEVKDYQKLRFSKVTKSNLLSESEDPMGIVSRKLVENSDFYRTYLRHRFFIRDSTDDALYGKYGDAKKAAPWIDYRKSSKIADEFIRDWYLTSISIDAFKNYDFTEAQNVLEKSLADIKDPQFKRLLRGFRDQVISTLDNKIPKVKLISIDGKEYGFDSFEGKVIYVTFWATSCAPCLKEFELHRPAFNARFANDSDLAVVNVCLDADISTWRKLIDKYGISGVNVRGTYEEISPKFQVHSIPRYMIVDKKGKIREYSATSSKDLLNDNGIIEQLLRE
ncbi:TlpA family protein disulfide reductase [Pedobacter deserti]|uniref:TlpA family protein disulfide reductase n=1 Tax=Pedobacter deserti TaxID=2817382 RepID=UPI00210DE65C|nr:TlpA disulfide reductase family protein [Pedobacter sp. SYSU D00382]